MISLKVSSEKVHRNVSGRRARQKSVKVHFYRFKLNFVDFKNQIIVDILQCSKCAAIFYEFVCVWVLILIVKENDEKHKSHATTTAILDIVNLWIPSKFFISIYLFHLLCFNIWLGDCHQQTMKINMNLWGGKTGHNEKCKYPIRKVVPLKELSCPWKNVNWVNIRRISCVGVSRSGVQWWWWWYYGMQSISRIISYNWNKKSWCSWNIARLSCTFSGRYNLYNTKLSMEWIASRMEKYRKMQQYEPHLIPSRKCGRECLSGWRKKNHGNSGRKSYTARCKYDLSGIWAILISLIGMFSKASRLFSFDLTVKNEWLLLVLGSREKRFSEKRGPSKCDSWSPPTRE